MMQKFLLLVLFILLSISISGFSQETDDKQNWGVWLSSQNRFKITSRIFYRDDISYRHLIKYDKWQRLSYNPAIVFNATNEIEIYMGIGNLFTLQDVISNSYELRVWQGVKFSWPFIYRLHFDHLLRIEERFVYEIEDNIWDNGYRGRYRLNLKIPINKNAIADNTFYTGASAEIYTNFGNEIPEKYVDQMRFSATIGYRKNTRWTFELLYVADRSKEIKEGYFELNNNIIRFKILNVFSL